MKAKILILSLLLTLSSQLFANSFNDLLAWDLEQAKVRKALETANGSEKIKLMQRWFSLCEQGKIMQYLSPYADCNELISEKASNEINEKNKQDNILSVFKYAVLERATADDKKELTDQVKIEVRIENTSNYHVTGNWGSSYYPGRVEKYINDFDRCIIKFVSDFQGGLNDAIEGIRDCQKATNQLPHLNAKFVL
ncbi:hypothetical protein [Gallibacterium anatis]|uniref:Uncharacterized protein n=1 Tax=Gallibacterium anatis TaxID=750 RepID=A0A1A7P4B2_9PAST|nr:hypothetical protein [Gallibacterium anatis]OBW97292.1 hypothetical protein QV02_00805 [Gallibacterium anatis]OBW99033.1 hypothetical protein QV03_04445 [Gallibacterium anatis]